MAANRPTPMESVMWTASAPLTLAQGSPTIPLAISDISRRARMARDKHFKVWLDGKIVEPEHAQRLHADCAARRERL
jgi:hypothetical protein